MSGGRSRTGADDRLAAAAIGAARRLAAAGEIDAALRVLEVAEAGAPPSLPALDLRARIHAQAGRYGDAIAAWRAVLERAPEQAEARRGLALAERRAARGSGGTPVRPLVWVALAGGMAFVLAAAFGIGRLTASLASGRLDPGRCATEVAATEVAATAPTPAGRLPDVAAAGDTYLRPGVVAAAAPVAADVPADLADAAAMPRAEGRSLDETQAGADPRGAADDGGARALSPRARGAGDAPAESAGGRTRAATSALVGRLATLEVAGTTIDPGPGDVAIRFDGGLFRSGGVALRPGAESMLTALAGRLRELAVPVIIEVVGETDARPMRPGRAYRDNGALALARAVAATDVLRSASALPVASFRVLGRVPSAEAAPPSAAARSAASQRTVEIRVVPAPAPPPAQAQAGAAPS